MTKALPPHEIAPGEWIITTLEGNEKYGYEEFSNRTYPSLEACQQRIDNLNAALPELLMAATDVVECWERGDLASAVRRLDDVLTTGWNS